MTRVETDADLRLARFRIFGNAIEGLGSTYARAVTDRIFGLGDTARYEIDRKTRDPEMASARTPTRSDVLAAQLLELLHKEGYRLNEFEFDNYGELVSAPKGKAPKE